MMNTETKKICPGSEGPCLGEDCVMYIDDIGCRLALVPRGFHPAKTDGKRCPFFRDFVVCGDFCALHRDGGCGMTGERTARKSRRAEQA